MLQKNTNVNFRVLDPVTEIAEDITNLRGEEYIKIFYKIRKIVDHQFNNKVSKGIKGFLLWGDVGLGKTVMVKALTKDLSQPLIFVDGSDIARARYGESEQLIAGLFRYAHGKCLILIDDAESVFPRRDWVKGESWHVAQNNVLFHEIDQIDTSKTCIFLTTNEINLMDKALRDRLYEIEFPMPKHDDLLNIARDLCEHLMIKPGPIIHHLRNMDLSSIRQVERIVLEYYVEGR